MHIGPIAADADRPLWAWEWLRHSAPAARLGLQQLAERHRWDANALAAVIAHESGGDPAALNMAGSGATGLIQFMPETARRLGTSVETLGRMSTEEQLLYVERYFAGVLQVPPPEVADYYMAVFLPSRIGDPDETELARKGSKLYDQNAGLDGDKDGLLTVGDVKQSFRRVFWGVQSRVAAGSLGQLDLVGPRIDPPPRAPLRRGQSGKSGLLVGGLVIGLAGLAWWRFGR